MFVSVNVRMILAETIFQLEVFPCSVFENNLHSIMMREQSSLEELI